LLEPGPVDGLPHLALKVGDDILVLHPQHEAGQDPVPVVHEPDVLPIVVADLAQAVGELLTFSEELLEAAEAAGHGVAARVDDLCESLLCSYGTSADDTAGLDPVLRDGGSYEIYAPEATTTDLWIEVGSAGDVDADGKDDVLLTVVPYIWGDQEGTPRSGSVYLLMGVDLPLLDSADGRSDGRIFLSNLVRERQR